MKGDNDKSGLGSTKPSSKQLAKSPYKFDPNLSYEETVARLENFIKLAKDKETSFALQRELNKFIKEKEERDANHTTAKLYHAQGASKGIHSPSTEKMDRDREHTEIAKNNKTLESGKGLYHFKHSLSLEFGETEKLSELKREFLKNKDKGPSRER
jgi:hypothetical protein